MTTKTVTILQGFVWVACFILSFLWDPWRLRHPYWFFWWLRYPISFFWRLRDIEDVQRLFSLARAERLSKVKPERLIDAVERRRRERERRQ
jgi:hypothetical protein